MLSRFYHYTLDEIADLTLSQFIYAIKYMSKISKMENPDPEDKDKLKGNADDLSNTLKRFNPNSKR